MLNRILSIFIVLIILVLLLTGCGVEEPNDVVVPSETNVSEVLDNPNKAGSYPNRRINNIIPFGAGGGTDLWNRALSNALQETLGVKIIVNNMPGGGPGGIASNYVWKQPHDGYTLLGTSETSLLLPVMMGDNKITKDYEYFIAGGSPGIICVNKKVNISTLEELKELAQSNPQKYSISSTSGGLWYILANLIKNHGNVPLNNATYDGSRPAVFACITGESVAVTASVGEVIEFVISGDLIPIAAIQLEDYDMNGFGVVPAITKTIPEFKAYLPLNQFLGFSVPADTEPSIIKELQNAFTIVMTSEQIIEFAAEQDAEIYNLIGDEAREFCEIAQSKMSWILYEFGLAEHNPEKFNITKH